MLNWRRREGEVVEPGINLMWTRRYFGIYLRLYHHTDKDVIYALRMLFWPPKVKLHISHLSSTRSY